MGPCTLRLCTKLEFIITAKRSNVPQNQRDHVMMSGCSLPGITDVIGTLFARSVKSSSFQAVIFHLTNDPVPGTQGIPAWDPVTDRMIITVGLPDPTVRFGEI